jgi:hypothetical protein
MISKTIIEVLFATDENAMIRIIGHEDQAIIGSESIYNKKVFQYWKEYKEPQKAEAWVNIYKHHKTGSLSFGIPHKTKETALIFAVGDQIIDTIKIEYTETE